MSKFIDLAAPLNENTPVYPGDQKVKISTGGIFDKDGYEDNYLTMGTHVGTHIDAPSHMVKDGKKLSDFPIEKLVGKGVLIETGKEITLEKFQKANIDQGEIVLIKTGMSAIYHQPEYFTTYPALSEAVAQYLISKRIKMLGMDTASVDYEPYPIHKLLLAQGVLLIENLTNLDQLINKGFKVYALPLKVALDGSPARVIAEII